VTNDNCNSNIPLGNNVIFMSETKNERRIICKSANMAINDTNCAQVKLSKEQNEYLK
jgi:hypothetical protein